MPTFPNGFIWGTATAAHLLITIPANSILVFARDHGD